jgi:hypothetical protein
MLAQEHLRRFKALLRILKGQYTVSWLRKGSQAEDKVYADAADLVLDSASNADYVGKVELGTGKNLRDQLTVEEAESLRQEANLRRFPRRN